MADIHADIDAIKQFREDLTRFLEGQRSVADRGDREIERARASLDGKERRWRLALDQRRAELETCLRAAANAAAAGHGGLDCSGCARRVQEARERLENVRRWQQTLEGEADIFRANARRFRRLLDTDLRHTDRHLLAVINRLQEARGLRVTET